jgi:hypothetical protein
VKNSKLTIKRFAYFALFFDGTTLNPLQKIGGGGKNIF